MVNNIELNSNLKLYDINNHCMHEPLYNIVSVLTNEHIEGVHGRGTEYSHTNLQSIIILYESHDLTMV
jgi:hypothetical protein